MKKDNHR